MSGIVGWVDYGRDVRTQGAVLRSMAGTLATRGPDAERVWLGQHAGLGHRRLAVLDHAGADQPASVQADGRTVATVSYGGQVDNHRELRSELNSRGHSFAGESDAEVVARSYLEWGVEFAARLSGQYAVALWDHEQERLVLVRDRMGIKPLYYAETPHGLVVGSEPKALFAHPLVEPVVDADGLREALAFVNTPGQTGYRGVFEVPPGCVMRFSRDGLRQHRYWQLQAQEHTDDLDTTVARVRTLLENSIDRQLAADVPVGTLLSGGLDSSAVTALMAERLGAAGRGPVRSFAIDFAGYEENFTADDMRATPDTPFVREAAEFLRADHTNIVLSSDQVIDPVVRAQASRAFDFPAVGDIFTSLYLLVAALREHASVALSGESADEIFGGYRWFHDDTAWADTFPWLAGTAQGIDPETQPGGTLFNDAVLKHLDIPGYQADSYRTALGEVPHTDTADPTERRMRELGYFHLTRFGPFLFDRQDRMSMAHGVEMRLPICDPELVQYVFNTPWSMKTFDGREKSLLRAATNDLLPESIINRVKSPYPATQDPGYQRALRGQFDNLIADGTSPVLSLLDTSSSRALEPARRDMELALSLHDWLTTSGARLDLAL